jgi:transcription-repair coupling factor (superfamily II helicase)
MQHLIESLTGGVAFRSLERALATPAARAGATNLAGSSKSLVVAALVDRARRGQAPWRTVLVVTPHTEAADRTAQDLQAFLGEGSTRVFPAWEVLPYEDREPHPDVVGERLEFLARLARSRSSSSVPPTSAGWS